MPKAGSLTEEIVYSYNSGMWEVWAKASLDLAFRGDLLCSVGFLAASSNGGGGRCCSRLEEECRGKDGSFLSYVCQVDTLLELHHSPHTSLFISSFF